MRRWLASPWWPVGESDHARRRSLVLLSLLDVAVADLNEWEPSCGVVFDGAVRTPSSSFVEPAGNGDRGSVRDLGSSNQHSDVIPVANAAVDSVYGDATREPVCCRLVPGLRECLERPECRRELPDRTLVWNQRHPLHTLRESRPSTTSIGLIGASPTHAR